MDAFEFRTARKKRQWTQHEAAKRLGVSQSYVALMERGKRPFSSHLGRKAVRLLNMSPLRCL
jgi:transcriptional regulator with XRE-family HTH domain